MGVENNKKSNIDPFDCYVLGYCIANSHQPLVLVLWGCSMNEECMKMLAAVENGRSFDYIKTIDFTGNPLKDQGAVHLGELYN